MFSRAANAAYAARPVFRSPFMAYSPAETGYAARPGWYDSLGECVHDALLSIGLASFGVSSDSFERSVPDRLSPEEFLVAHGISPDLLGLAAAFEPVADTQGLAEAMAANMRSLLSIGVSGIAITSGGSGFSVGPISEFTIVVSGIANGGVFFSAAPPGAEDTRAVETIGNTQRQLSVSALETPAAQAVNAAIVRAFAAANIPLQ